MIPPDEEWRLDTRRLGRRVLVYRQTASTNTLVSQLAERGEPEGVAVLADEQTAGRGQYGRSWLAPPRSGVLLSLLVRPPLTLARPAVLTALAAVSVCRIVQEVAKRTARIKWPNDVLVEDRKLCGILIEQIHSGAEVSAVVGIGLNVGLRPDQLAALGLPSATSLATFTTDPLDTHALAAQLLRRLDEDYSLLLTGESAQVEQTWRTHLGLLGRPVLVTTAEGSLGGQLERLTLTEVCVRADSGVVSLQPEQVRQLEATAT
jgi:BirA family biotin operon repressor/biotin-[acetyl-CoA-carboxylase] ligase